MAAATDLSKEIEKSNELDKKEVHKTLFSLLSLADFSECSKEYKSQMFDTVRKICEDLKKE